MLRLFISFLLVALLALPVGAVTLTFENSSSNASWFSILHIPADTTKRPTVFVRDIAPSTPPGVVTIVLPPDYIAGDCYWVYAIGRGGPSLSSNSACVGMPSVDGTVTKAVVGP